MVGGSMSGRPADQLSHSPKSRHVSMITFGGISGASLSSYGALAASVFSPERVFNFLVIAIAQLRLRTRLPPACAKPDTQKGHPGGWPFVSWCARNDSNVRPSDS